MASVWPFSFFCGSARTKEHVDNDSNVAVRGASTGEEPPERCNGQIPDAQLQWQAAQDENYYVLYHKGTGTVVELVRHSKGWFQCRDCKWQMHTLYPDGHVDVPRVQVMDAEHLITQIRNDVKGAKVSRGEFGHWKISKSEHGHLIITHRKEREQILVLMSTGFTFVGSEGHAVLVDELGLNKLSQVEAQAMLKPA
mmetsp:Transcript_274/g.542  ORF Transcript_274/g.542 Transcript_274/m.542 type:complete len:196 (-) Transcript_274:73-660(-)|eukprot:CAMPEP_0179444514 /NCGR_PEP_ID=MMETSP0799-20121207/27961_1 /TAXON_ID=46947 /ORGANISM="Geminigera cryophila, Strain CCMP2564" /LENGTH=195 /DNA_ID=CAMNT_0021231635 /DNA_START=18 /DNA_END=605 /DNA_ORIENTATION=-